MFWNQLFLSRVEPIFLVSKIFHFKVKIVAQKFSRREMKRFCKWVFKSENDHLQGDFEMLDSIWWKLQDFLTQKMEFFSKMDPFYSSKISVFESHFSSWLSDLEKIIHEKKLTFWSKKVPIFCKKKWKFSRKKIWSKLM